MKLCCLVIVLLSLLRFNKCILRDLADCHDDHGLKPRDGMLREHTFSWLGFAQYIHVTTGLLHHSRAPRVVLIHKQFGLGTAADMLSLPKNYKMGNVVFGDYERDEEDCQLTKSQIKIGLTCGRAYVEMPIADIVPHPEFTRFGVGNSLVLIKFIRPMKSHYMVPVCYPSPFERERIRRKKVVFLVDYISIVPRDFDVEKLAKKTLKLFTHKECRRHRMRARLGSEGVTHVLCTSGCGVRSGAPIITHAVDGPFELVGINAGGGACRRKSNRRRLNPQPPIYIDIFPYTQWITNIITAHIMPRPYPEHFQLTEFGGMQIKSDKSALRKPPQKSRKEGWRSRTFVSGRSCYDRTSKQKRMAFFYDEKFEVNADPPGKLNIMMKIFATYDIAIQCVKMSLPNRLVDPDIRGVRESNISIEFLSEWFPYTFYFSLGLYGRNSTAAERGDWWEWAMYGRP